jgi:hypothetical protein
LSGRKTYQDIRPTDRVTFKKRENDDYSSSAIGWSRNNLDQACSLVTTRGSMLRCRCCSSSGAYLLKRSYWRSFSRSCVASLFSLYIFNFGNLWIAPTLKYLGKQREGKEEGEENKVSKDSKANGANGARHRKHAS